MKKINLLLVIGTLISYNALAQLCFSPTNNFSIGVYPRSFTSADFNGDGKKDIASGFSNNGICNVAIILGNGAGSFSAATTFSIANTPLAMVSADFNADGKMDIAIASGSGLSYYVSIHLGNGVGGFLAASIFTVNSGATSLVSVDINGDGKIDLATGNSFSNNISVILGNGVGGFSGATNFGVGSEPESIARADFNGDGKQDLATANFTSGNVSVLLGNGLGSFSAVTNYSVGLYCHPISCADFNGDGFTDIVTFGTGINCIAVLLGTGTGSFSTAIYYYQTGNLRSIVSSDFNMDGKMDIASVSSTTNDIKIHLGNGLGSFSSVTSFSVGTAPNSVLIDDFNGDGKMDLASNNFQSYDVSVMLGNVTYTLQKTNVTCNGGNNGSSTVIVTCGIPPLTYSWSTFPAQTTATATGLTSGIYTVTVIDAAGAIKSSTVSITQPPALTATLSSTGNTKCSGICNGSASIISLNGPSPYSYIWDHNSNDQTTATADFLCEGRHNVTYYDGNGCIGGSSIDIISSTVANSDIYLTNLAAIDQANVSPAFASYYSYNLPVSIIPSTSNPRNFVDPGKKARFKVECTNQKSNGLSIVSGICKVRSNNQFISITDSSSSLNNIGWNATKWSADEFEIDIDPNTPPGTNAYIDFVVQENGQDFKTTCIAIPITPLVYSPTTLATIDDDNNPDSQGNDDEICNPGETIEFYPWLDNISKLDAEYARGRFENLDNHSYINIWNGVSGVNTTVYDATWWNFYTAQPQMINSGSVNTTPEYDFVFDYNNSNTVNNFKLYLVMAGGFKLFATNALSLVQWTLPYTFNTNGVISVNELESTSFNINAVPNPSSGIFKISNNSMLNITSMKIFNSKGQIVWESVKFVSEIDLSDQAKGIYFLQLKSENKIVNKKIIFH